MKAIVASIALNSTTPFNNIFNTQVFDRTAIMNNDNHESWDIVGGGREGHWVSELKKFHPDLILILIIGTHSKTPRFRFQLA